MSVIEQMLQRYPQDSNEARTHALREVMQEIALAGLYRGGFFDKAAFSDGSHVPRGKPSPGRSASISRRSDRGGMSTRSVDMIIRLTGKRCASCQPYG